jgi:small subunit ribosomal protein S20
LEGRLANTSSAEKRMRQERKRTAHNRAQRSRMKTAIKKVGGAGTRAEAEDALKEVSAMLDRFATRNLIHRNKAARKKSQLAKQVARRAD